MSEMTPREIVNELDKHIVAQSPAKRAVAIALRNRWRRSQVDARLRGEITPKNILMIGPTGVGKTEIARRLAKLANAPFIKVEATKFTEVGYVGREVDSIIRDLVEMAIKQTREQAMVKFTARAEDAAEERVLDIFVPPARAAEGDKKNSAARQLFRKKLREGDLDNQEIEIDIRLSQPQVEIMGAPGMEEMSNQLSEMLQNFNQDKKKTRKMRVIDALKAITEEEAGKLVNHDDIKTAAIERTEQHGIVFLDEIDKIVGREGQNQSGGQVSREGVQRDLLPIVEGCTVSTKHGSVKTDHILFIASGAFAYAKPADLIPELQGRLPIRVELRALEVVDFVRILTEPHACLTEQYTALLATEGVALDFADSGVQRIAEVAWEVNDNTENIGARRLHTIMERLLETLSFAASDRAGEQVTINAAYVDEHLLKLVKDQDLSRYIL